MWTRFMDMHSGGGAKEGFEYLYIEAPEEEAKVIFYNRFGHSPDRVSCTCCGEDYSICEHDSLDQATAYNRNCAYDSKTKAYIERGDRKPLVSLADYLKSDGVVVIRAEEIKPEERIGDVPREGFVWL